ncbi:MAG TPA: DUF3311 domain-containing protein [Acidisoma sp.]|jgi:hypothetical protein|nr:DUF3311 domain-containing protein [Acidisoma sp.]
MPGKPHPRPSFWRILLILPVIAVLAVGFFNRSAPSFLGFPFFYWYQMLWVLLCSVITGLVFLIEDLSGGDAGDEL